jgi:hypothetical protein
MQNDGKQQHLTYYPEYDDQVAHSETTVGPAEKKGIPSET